MERVEEAIKTPLGTTILITMVVIILLIVFTIIKEAVLADETIDVLILFLALLPFIIYLATTGKISEIGGGGLGIKFNKASEAEVFKSEEVAYSYNADLVKSGTVELRREILPKMTENPQSTLKILGPVFTRAQY